MMRCIYIYIYIYSRYLGIVFGVYAVLYIKLHPSVILQNGMKIRLYVSWVSTLTCMPCGVCKRPCVCARGVCMRECVGMQVVCVRRRKVCRTMFFNVFLCIFSGCLCHSKAARKGEDALHNHVHVSNNPLHVLINHLHIFAQTKHVHRNTCESEASTSI